MPESYTTFGDFLLLRQRSQDGLGSLWRAGELERTGFKRIVWLRRFDGAGLDRAALGAEGGIVRQLAQAFKATNVVRNVSFGSVDGVLYLAYDYIAGQPLDQLLARVARDQFPIAIDNALLIVEKIAAALAAAQAFEVRGEPLTHGFLVPNLVLVGNDGEAMVAGFGLAKGFLSNLDRVAVREMAAPYLAPEVLATYGASRKSDVYSLGAILYQLLCGEALPADPSARPGALSSPQLALDEGPVPADVLSVMRKALAERPEDRFASAIEFKRDLEKLLYGGAYSPTTFNLALFMDRLYRQEIEEEDRELQRERTIDVTPYYRPPEPVGEAAAPAVAAAPSSRTGLYAALGAVAVLLAVVGYLMFGRSTPAPQTQQNVADLIQSEVARQLAEKEQQLRSELDKEKQETDRLRQQLASQQKAAVPGAKISPEAQKQQEELRQQLAAREEEQTRREAELKKLQDERARAAAAAAAKPTAVPAAPAAAPTAVPAEPTHAPLVAGLQPTAVAKEAEAPKPAPTTAPLAPSLPPAGLGTTVSENDLVDFTQVDTPPQELVTAKPTFGRAAMIAKARGIEILSVLVNSKGAVDDVKVLRPFPATNLGIDEACVEAARKYRFRPATKNGVNVRTWTTVTIQIDLARGR